MAILEDPVTTWMAFVCTWFSNALCVYLIVQHIRNYTQPQFQRYICRIIFIVPFYCTASWLALHHRESSIYFETPRDCYEAWVIYNFMALCMAYVGGPGAVVVKSEGKMIQPSWVLCTCCMKPIPVDGFFLRKCKQGTLQFVIIKPILALVTLVLFIMDLYQVGNWSVSDGFLYEAILYNFCYSWALFWMLLFYVGTEDLLKPYKPLLKFFVFKTVIFLTFWQGMAVTFIATRAGWTAEDSEAMQNWLICVEMFFAAVGMLFAFPHQEYQLGGRATPGFKWEAFKHAVSISDVMEDIIFQFNPNYKSYVLHTDGGPSENVKRKKFRGKKAKKPAFTVIQNELGALGDKVVKMSKLKATDRRRLVGESGDLDLEEGGQWHSAARKKSMLSNLHGGIQSLTEKPREALSSWLPNITEAERRQAELLDSDSDAAYDEENQQDNQLDDEVLTSSDDEGGSPGRGRRHMQALGSSSDGEGRPAGGWRGSGSETGGQRARGGDGLTRADWSKFGAGGGGVGGVSRGPRQDDSWAQFPDPNARSNTQDGSWAQFPPPGSLPPAPGSPGPTPEPPTVMEMTSHTQTQPLGTHTQGEGSQPVSQEPDDEDVGAVTQQASVEHEPTEDSAGADEGAEPGVSPRQSDRSDQGGTEDRSDQESESHAQQTEAQAQDS